MFRLRPARPASSAEVVPLSRTQLLGVLAGLLLVGGVLLYGLGYSLVSSFSAGTAPGGVQSSAHMDADPAQQRDLIAAAPMAPVAEDAGLTPGVAISMPEILRGVDPSRWPQLVAEGRQAVTDLVASVIPMVYAQTRHALNAADLRGQMFVELMGAAHRFDPQRIGPERWPMYAWVTLEHARWRGVDGSGVVRKRSRNPRPAIVDIDGQEPASRAPGPDEVIEERQSIAAITHALGHLPRALRDPLLESMQGVSARAIGDEFGFSESTARRRIYGSRDYVKNELAPMMDDFGTSSDETVTDPVLERSQRLSKQAFSSLPDIGPGRRQAR